MDLREDPIIYSLSLCTIVDSEEGVDMDVVCTVPKPLWRTLLEEGDLPGEPFTGREYHFFGGGHVPRITLGERVYIVAHGRLRGYAPLLRVERAGVQRPAWWWYRASWALVRAGCAVACTLPTPIRGFRGYRYRFWERVEEMPFPAWQTEGVR